MGPFIVVPKIHNGRHTSYEIIDTKPASKHQARFGYIDDEHQAEALALVLNGAEAVYRAEIADLAKREAF